MLREVEERATGEVTPKAEAAATREAARTNFMIFQYVGRKKIGMYD
jgi:hypothetical protein